MLELSIEIVNWNKFNPRNDVKKSSWFRMENSIFENPDYFDFSHTHLAFWLYLLSLASKKNSAVININLKHAEKIGRFSLKEINQSIELLQQAKAILVSKPAPVATVADPLRARNEDVTLRNDTIRDDTIHMFPSGNERVKFDFQSLFKTYPKRYGKHGEKKAFEYCNRNLASTEKYAALAQAIINYRDYVINTGTVGTIGVMMFKTFVHNFEEWLIPISPPTIPLVNGFKYQHPDVTKDVARKLHNEQVFSELREEEEEEKLTRSVL